MNVWSYPLWLFGLSLLVLALETFFPWRKAQKRFRRSLPSDLVHIVINGHFLGVSLYVISERYVLPPLADLASRTGIDQYFPIGIAQPWPLWIQIPLAIVLFDFAQWCIHNLLHRVPFLWALHKTHHSVGDGEMDFIVSFRFHFGEVVVYKTLQYLPLLLFGFASEAIFVHAVAGTLIGHLNHSNLDLGYGPWRYLLNSPRMHIWHHDYDAKPNETKNFAIIFSAWDFLFGTARLEDHPPRKLGFEGFEDHRLRRGAITAVTTAMVLAIGWIAVQS